MAVFSLLLQFSLDFLKLYANNDLAIPAMGVQFADSPNVVDFVDFNTGSIFLSNVIVFSTSTVLIPFGNM